MSEVSNVLMVARNLLSHGWSRYEEARDIYRHPTSLNSEKVHAVSMDGAVKLALTKVRLKNRSRTEKRVLLRLGSLVRERVKFWVDNDPEPGFFRDPAIAAEGDDLRDDEVINGYLRLEAFNDSVARSKNEVLGVFDALLKEDGMIKVAPGRTP